MSASVDQGQRPIRPERPQIDDLRTDVEAPETVGLGRQTGLVDGQLLDSGADVDVTEIEQVVAVDGCHRRRRIEPLTADARPRDEDLLERTFGDLRLNAACEARPPPLTLLQRRPKSRGAHTDELGFSFVFPLSLE